MKKKVFVGYMYRDYTVNDVLLWSGYGMDKKLEFPSQIFKRRGTKHNWPSIYDWPPRKIKITIEEIE